MNDAVLQGLAELKKAIEAIPEKTVVEINLKSTQDKIAEDIASGRSPITNALKREMGK